MAEQPAAREARETREEKDKWIVNEHGVLHSIPADMDPPPGSRPATPAEVADFKVEDAKVALKNKAAADEARERDAKMVVNVGEEGAKARRVPRPAQE